MRFFPAAVAVAIGMGTGITSFSRRAYGRAVHSLVFNLYGADVNIIVDIVLGTSNSLHGPGTGHITYSAAQTGLALNIP